MQNLFVTALRDQNNPVVTRGLEILEKFPPANFKLVRDINDAAVVLYMEHGYVGLTDLPLILDRLQKHSAQKQFVFSESDWPYPLLPGAYPSLQKRRSWAHSWSFLIPTVTNSPKSSTPEGAHLFSFLGRIDTHPVRQKVRALDTAATPCMDVDEAPRRIHLFDYTRSYVDLIRASKFVLCPRGFGASSIRIFEAMSCGRVPVIISDRWQPPPGIEWQTFAVVVREEAVATIPALLAGLEAKADEMGQKALRTYSEFFAPQVFFDRLLASLISRYANNSFEPRAVLGHAIAAIDWRALRTLAHQARARASMLSR